MSNNRKLEDSLGNLRKAVDKLLSALRIPNDRELVVEGTIQRFEVVVELLWKTLGRALKYEGIQIQPDTPRQTMKEGFAAGFLHNEPIWQGLLDKRNTSSHEYLDEEFIEDYYEEIKEVTPEIVIVLEFMESRYF
ncbi:HI0074 family nucleotidyltransferase substrate-binding subunit [Rufibacter latericius]|uniref:Nucleotidyltransferase n=1 Tax=Rufibacter latericius TaxID=2487040 RepID=A0A3M9MBR5_9BACT|nr:HI0074 family nucleotidyltransferase substrate-binding subunit [Rufibacter latericius]RNI22615.1 nucleotidyltransferase [Rufibacter latericius]